MNIGYNRAISAEHFAAVILADRIGPGGSFPPQQYVNGQTCLAGLAETLRSAGISSIFVLSGSCADSLQDQLQTLRLPELHTDSEGSFAASSADALREVSASCPDCTGIFLISAEYPLITIRSLRDLMGACTEKKGEIFAPAYEGKAGQPLLISAGAADETASVCERAAAAGEGAAPEALTDLLRTRLTRVPCGDEECLMSTFAPGGSEALDHFAAKGFRREKLDTLSAMKRIFLIRASEAEGCAESTLRGVSDAPLSDRGRAKAEKTADEIAETISADVVAQINWVEGVSLGREPLPAAERVYCSGLPRAKETARIIAARINETYGDSGIRVSIHESDALLARSFGDWEGKTVSELKESDAENFALFQEDPFRFRAAGMTEDAYDLQYRAMAGLRKILEDDYAKNIIIISHADVIRALENNLKGLRVCDEWETVSPGEYHIWIDTARR